MIDASSPAFTFVYYDKWPIVNVSIDLILYNDGFCLSRFVPLSETCVLPDRKLFLALFHHHPVKMAVSSKLCIYYSRSFFLESAAVIMKICPYNDYTIIPQFCIVKLVFTGVYLFFLFLIQRLGEAVLTCTYDVCFQHKN